MSRERTATTDDGISLVEVVIAMFLFALLSVAILPLAIQAQSLSTVNRDASSASAFASGLLAEVRGEFADTGGQTCTEVRSYLANRADETGLIDDPAATGQTARVVIDEACPGDTLRVATVHARVFDSRSTATAAGTSPTATITTQIVVSGP